jgi:tRNA C32,U32 (ribose-2'-O)-methylase TrmJ
MNFVPSPEPKIAESTQKALNRLDRIREAMGLSLGELNKLLVDVLGSNAPVDYRYMNSSQAMHVIRYMARNGAKILLQRSQNAKNMGNK